jgi:hypothetical protein
MVAGGGIEPPIRGFSILLKSMYGEFSKAKGYKA